MRRRDALLCVSQLGSIEASACATHNISMEPLRGDLPLHSLITRESLEKDEVVYLPVICISRAETPREAQKRRAPPPTHAKTRAWGKKRLERKKPSAICIYTRGWERKKRDRVLYFPSVTSIKAREFSFLDFPELGLDLIRDNIWGGGAHEKLQCRLALYIRLSTPNVFSAILARDKFKKLDCLHARSLSGEFFFKENGIGKW